jgi:hypothetical protein
MLYSAASAEPLVVPLEVHSGFEGKSRWYDLHIEDYVERPDLQGSGPTLLQTHLITELRGGENTKFIVCRSSPVRKQCILETCTDFTPAKCSLSSTQLTAELSHCCRQWNGVFRGYARGQVSC